MLNLVYLVAQHQLDAYVYTQNMHIMCDLRMEVWSQNGFSIFWILSLTITMTKVIRTYLFTYDKKPPVLVGTNQELAEHSTTQVVSYIVHGSTKHVCIVHQFPDDFTMY